MQKILIILLALTTLSCSTMKQNDGNKGLQVNTENGVIEGLKDSTKNLNVFLGIPYAKPPVNDLRWKAPQPLDNWEGVKETKKFANRAVQRNVWGDMIYRSDTISEDCLYLNLWAPEKKTNESLPVLVYIHGGGFIAGTGNEPRYDGASMAQKGIIVVTVNYRLNIFGFFTHPELSAEAPYKASGNYGLLDQVAALKWVNKNIAAFGGDPSKVTIAGESAGSISVSSHMASPLSKDLFAGAIGESGAAINPTTFPRPLKVVEQIGADFAKKNGYSTLAELRALSTEELFAIYNKGNNYRFLTAIDGYFFTKTLPETFEAKEQAQIPLLAGWNSAEIPAQAFLQGNPFDKESFIAKTNQRFNELTPQILDVYPHETIEDIIRSATNLASDQFISFSTWKWIDLHTKNSSQATYRYLFSHIRTQNRDQISKGLPAPYGASHASEIEYCMGNLYLIKNTDWTEADYAVEKLTQNYFASFIKTGNPNNGVAPNWPKLKSGEEIPAVMNLDKNPVAFKAIDDERYPVLEKFYEK